jgi:hypothetical protein
MVLSKTSSKSRPRNQPRHSEPSLNEYSSAPQTQEGFLKAVHDSLVDGIQYLLGKSTCDVLIDSYHLDKLTNAPQELHDQLSHIFGSNAVVLERVIVKELYNTCDLNYTDTEPFNFNLTDHLNTARKQFMIKTVWRLKENGRAN